LCTKQGYLIGFFEVCGIPIPVHQVALVFGKLEYFLKISNCLVYIEITAGIYVNINIADLHKGMEANMALSNKDKP